ncbi:hypothetical protein QVA66_04455 [Staphylococcus chromogenes]|nr:hypothetical protein [Staphylococcus chromogenes]
MPIIDRSTFSLNAAELTLLLQQAEPKALVLITEARQRNKGLSNAELARVLERNFVTKPTPEEEFLENAAAYVCAVGQLYDREIAAHGNNQELLGTVLNLAKQIDKAENAVAAQASKLADAVAARIPAVSAGVDKLLPGDKVSAGAEVAGAAIVALATRRALKAAYGIALEPPKM